MTSSWARSNKPGSGFTSELPILLPHRTGPTLWLSGYLLTITLTFGIAQRTTFGQKEFPQFENFAGFALFTDFSFKVGHAASILRFLCQNARLCSLRAV
jgi:hypothetical protein